MSDLPSLPAWTKTLQRRIRQRGINFFILHGPGVRDLHPLGARRFGTIGDCLAQVILSDRSAIVMYDRGAGIGFSDRDVENDLKTVLKAYDKLGGTNLAHVQPRDPDRALQLIETYLRYQLTGNPRFSAAVIIDYGETVAPAGEPGQLPAEDRGAIVTLRRWASEPLFLQRNVTFCLLVETTATLSAALVGDARTFEIAVPVPDEQERYAYLAARGSRPETFATVDARSVAILTAGLTRLHLESLLAESEADGAPLDQDALTREKKRLIEEASGGLLTFMTSGVGLDAVAGHEGAKALLRETARALSQGRLDVVPMGYLICGPVGTGKSFIVQCFAKEIGIPVVELLNFRSKWQGQTEANLGRVRAGVRLAGRLHGRHAPPGQGDLVPHDQPARPRARGPEASGAGRGAPGAVPARHDRGTGQGVRSATGAAGHRARARSRCRGAVRREPRRALGGRPRSDPGARQPAHGVGGPDDAERRAVARAHPGLPAAVVSAGARVPASHRGVRVHQPPALAAGPRRRTAGSDRRPTRGTAGGAGKVRVTLSP